MGNLGSTLPLAWIWNSDLTTYKLVGSPQNCPSSQSSNTSKFSGKIPGMVYTIACPALSFFGQPNTLTKTLNTRTDC